MNNVRRTRRGLADRAKDQRGTTLVELLVAMSISLVISAMILLSWFALSGSYANTVKRVKASDTVRFALARMEREIRDAEQPPASSTEVAVVRARPYYVELYTTFNEAGNQFADVSPRLVMYRLYSNGELWRFHDADLSGAIANVSDTAESWPSITFSLAERTSRRGRPADGVERGQREDAEHHFTDPCLHLHLLQRRRHARVMRRTCGAPTTGPGSAPSRSTFCLTSTRASRPSTPTCARRRSCETRGEVMSRTHLRCTAGRERERGAGLVLIIGVVAALAISAATLVALTANVQHNTADTRQHVKSFDICEAGLDAGMAMLSSSWPTTSTSIPTFNASAFRSRFSLSEFPDPATGQFIALDVVRQPRPDRYSTHATTDENDDGIMWLVAQAKVGNRATRVVSEVERSYMEMALAARHRAVGGGQPDEQRRGQQPEDPHRGAAAGRHDDDRAGGRDDRRHQRHAVGCSPDHGKRHHAAGARSSRRGWSTP